jgi:hypothetical protein
VIKVYATAETIQVLRPLCDDHNFFEINLQLKKLKCQKSLI